jgi:hypothetical protein
MKVLFNMLALVLLCAAGSAAMAAVGDELGCLVGDCENGVGTLVAKTDKGLLRYRGAFVNGKYHGFGILELIDERITYKGNFLAGLRNGRGTQWDRDSNVYIGLWRNDRRNGQGLQAYKVQGWSEDKYTENWLAANTENYQGGFLNDNFDGQGAYRWADGVTYTGGWAANKKHGRGTFLYPSGNRTDRIFNFDVRVYDEPPAL